MPINTLQPGNVPWLASPWRRHWIWGVEAERPSTRGGTSQNSGWNDRVWGGRGVDRPGADRLRGGSTGTHKFDRVASFSRFDVETQGQDDHEIEVKLSGKVIENMIAMVYSRLYILTWSLFPAVCGLQYDKTGPRKAADMFCYRAH